MAVMSSIGAGESESTGGNSNSSSNSRLSERLGMCSPADARLLELEHSATFVKDLYSRRRYSGSVSMHGFDREPGNEGLTERGATSINRFALHVLRRRENITCVRGGAYVVTEDVTRGTIVSNWTVFITSDLHFVIEAPHILAPSSRETLISLLDTAEELGCPRAIVCIERSQKHLKHLVRAFHYYGFEMQHPGAAEDFGLQGLDDSDFVLMAVPVHESDSN